MKRVTGLGGVFFRAQQPSALYEWYEKHLGIRREADGSGAMFHWRDAENPAVAGITIWSIFPDSTKYFGSNKAFMMNFRVENLDELLKLLRAEGVQVDEKVEEHEYGKFAWVTDPEGNRIELWEPPAEP